MYNKNVFTIVCMHVFVQDRYKYSYRYVWIYQGVVVYSSYIY
jgi:hypothetical protein